MKRYILIVAAVALATVSCSRHYDVNHHSEGMPINLSSWADNLTKARTVGGTAFASGDVFYVYGFNTKSTTNTPVFDGVTVTAQDTDPLTWQYTPIRFWDSNTDSYTFYAVSPSENTVTVANLIDTRDVTAGTMTSKDLTFSGANNDVLVADKKVVVNDDYGKKVELNFRHAAAKFDLKVRKGAGLVAAGATVNVIGVSLVNIESKGRFAVTGYNAATADPDPNKALVARWTLADTPVPAEFKSENDVDDSTTPVTPAISSSNKVEVTATLSSDPTSQYLIKDLIVMPQDFNATTALKAGQGLKISYEIITGTGTAAQTVTFTDKVYDLVLFDETDYDTDDDTGEGVDYNKATKVTGWDPGIHYTYIVTLDANAIEFTAKMQAWGTESGYYYLIN